MHCIRCHGSMVVDHFLEMADAGGHLWLRAWRCVNCGRVVEPGLSQRRETHGSKVSILARLRAWLLKRPTRHHDAVPLGV